MSGLWGSQLSTTTLGPSSGSSERIPEAGPAIRSELSYSHKVKFIRSGFNTYAGQPYPPPLSTRCPSMGTQEKLSHISIPSLPPTITNTNSILFWAQKHINSQHMMEIIMGLITAYNWYHGSIAIVDNLSTGGGSIHKRHIKICGSIFMVEVREIFR